MSAAQHTPGPWYADGVSVHAVNGSVSRIACVHFAEVGRNWSGSDYSHPAIQAANAKVIAASPELFERAQAVIAAWDKLAPLLPVMEAVEDLECGEMNRLRSAVRMVTGEPT